MKCYALGALAIYDSLYDIMEVSMSIFQPRRENVSTWTVPVEDLRAWAEEELKPKAEMAIRGEGAFCAGEWCQFCRAAVKCRARAEEKLKIAQKEFRLPPLLSDEEIEELLPSLPDITKWANDIAAYALESAVHHGKEWNGYKVVEGRSNRKYSDEDAVAKAAKAHGYTDIYKQSLITINEMQKLMVKKYPDLERGESASQTGRDHIPTRVFKQMARLNKQHDKLVELLSDVKLTNYKDKTAQVVAFLEKYIPDVAAMETQMKKYEKYFKTVDTKQKALEAENEKLTVDLKKSQQESTLKRLQEARLQNDYERAKGILDRIPPEIIRAYTHGTKNKEVHHYSGLEER